MENRKSLLVNTLVYAIGDIVPRVLSFLVFPVLTTYLSPEDYGIVNYVNSLNLLLYIIGIFSLNTYYLVYYHRKSDEDKKRMLGTLNLFVIVVNVILLLLCVAIGFVVPSVFSSNIVFYPYILIGLVTNFFSLFFVFPSALYRMQERPVPLTALNVTKGILTTLLTLILVVVYHGDAVGVLMSNFVVTAFFAIIFLYITAKNMIFCFDRDLIKDALRFSLPLLPGSLAYFLLSMSDRFFIERYLSLRDLGIYSTAVTLAMILNIVINGAYKAVEPYLYKIYGESSFSDIFHQILYILCATVILLGLGISLFSKEFFQIFASEKYQDVYQYVPLSVLSLVISSASVLYGTLLCAQNRTKQNSYATMLGGITSVVLNLLLIPFIGLYGSCIASIVSFVTILVYSMYASQSKINNVIFRLAALLVVSAIMVWFSIYLSPFENMSYSILFKVTCFSLVFLPVSYKSYLIYQKSRV